MGEQVISDLDTTACKGETMQTPARRRQQGLIREALYVFLVIAVVMAVLLDGLALFTAQQDARDDAADAGAEAKQAYVETGSVDLAREAAETHLEANEGEMVDFSSAPVSGSNARSFTVTVRHGTETYLFKYLGYIPGLEEWVEDMENPTITHTTM
jgi:hypothetical protein